MVKDPSHAVKIGEASKVLGLHIDTLRRWEKSGKITPIRTPGGTRLYSLDELSSLVPKVLVNSSKPPKKTEQLPVKDLPKIDEEGIYVHIYNKGVDKRIIFNEKQDYEVFLSFLKDYLTTPKDPDSIKKVFKVHGRIFRGTPHQPNNYFNKIELLAYNLMPDHFHLLLHQKTRGSIENFIRSLCTRYSIYFNKKYQRSGALFEGPYKSTPIKYGLGLQHLSRFFHYTGDYSSYPEYLGTRKTSWVKPKVVLSLFDDNGTDVYKDFVGKYGLDQKEKALIEGITLERETQHLERSSLTDEEIHRDQEPELRLKMNEFVAISSVIFILLFTLGMRNIIISSATSVQPSTPPAVLGTVVKESTAPADTVAPKVILTVKIDDDGTSVNIRQKPTISSEKIGQAKNGDTFEFISLDSGWYEVKLTNGSTGFISEQYLKREGVNN